jgi:predicted secreted protein
MAAIVGYAGAAKLSTNTIAQIKSWEMSPNVDLADVTVFGDQWKDYLPTLVGADPKIEGFYDMTDTNGQVALQNALLGGTSVSLRLYVDATHYYSGTAYLKSMNVKAAVDGVVEFSADLSFSGAITYT